jgi:hypothetical protein
MPWTTFCVKRPGYEHVKHGKDLACGFCGQPNPGFQKKNGSFPVIDLSGDSPPRQMSATPGTYALQVSRQPILENQQTVRYSRQEAISRTQRGTPIPNAGSTVHSNRVIIHQPLVCFLQWSSYTREYSKKSGGKSIMTGLTRHPHQWI